MSQHDYVLDNQDGASFRADINLALAAILSVNSGATAPTVTKPFMPWLDTTIGVLKMRNAADTDWVSAMDMISGSQNFGLKNRIINGDMRFDERNKGVAVTPSVPGVYNYTLDRFALVIGQASKLTVQQVTDAPTGYKNSLKVTVAAQYAPISTDYFGIAQCIEGVNIVDLAFGTAGALTITTSAKVKSSIAGTYTVAFRNKDQTRSYVGTYSIGTANTWTPLVITIAGETSGVWEIGNLTGLNLWFDLGSGSNYNTTAGAWTAGSFLRTTGATTFVNQTAGSTWQITGVQLEKGAAATSFDNRLGELQLCQRYYEAVEVVHSNSPSTQYATGYWKTTKRASPTIATSQISGTGMPTIVNAGAAQVSTFYQSTAPGAVGTMLVTGSAELS